MGMEAFNSSLLTMKFEEWPRRNVSSSNLEILPDLSPLENLFVIFLGFPISSLPSFLPFPHNPVEISPISFRIYTNFCISRASSTVIPRRVESDF